MRARLCWDWGGAGGGAAGGAGWSWASPPFRDVNPNEATRQRACCSTLCMHVALMWLRTSGLLLACHISLLTTLMPGDKYCTNYVYYKQPAWSGNQQTTSGHVTPYPTAIPQSPWPGGQTVRALQSRRCSTARYCERHFYTAFKVIIFSRHHIVNGWRTHLHTTVNCNTGPMQQTTTTATGSIAAKSPLSSQ